MLDLRNFTHCIDSAFEILRSIFFFFLTSILHMVVYICLYIHYCSLTLSQLTLPPPCPQVHSLVGLCLYSHLVPRFFMTFFFLTSLLEYNCFTMVCYFLLYNKVNQLYIYIYPRISSILHLPPSRPPYPTPLGGHKTQS